MLISKSHTNTKWLIDANDLENELLGTMAHERRHRDADEEALQAALQESMQPDFLAQILEAEAVPATPTATARSPTSASSTVARARSASADQRPFPPKIRSASYIEDDDEDDSAVAKKKTPVLTDTESDGDDEDANADHQLLNLADFLLLDVLYFLDEDSVGHCIGACKRLRHVAKSEALFESLCRRIFPVQCPRVGAAAAKNRFALRKFNSWFDMLQQRPRVRHHGFYYLKTFYYKKPELNMWTTDIVPGTILQVVYYRYFSFQRDGTVLYAMLFKPPHEVGSVLKRLTKEVYIGTFQVDKNEVFVSVPTSHNVIEFKFHISSDNARGKHVKLVLKEHYAFSEPDRSGWVDYFDTADEVLPFYRQWDL